MPHVTFIHGIANKPKADDLLRDWKAELDGAGFNLGTRGVTSSLVYWADVMYDKPMSSSSSFESLDDGLGTEKKDEALDWVKNLDTPQKTVVASLIHKFGLDKAPPEEDREAVPEQPMGEDDPYAFEAIPLPWFIKERVMKRLLKDVHHYLFNERFSPRPGETYHVQTELRQRFVGQLEHDKTHATGPFVVVAHSMGTVISYDCLKNVASCPSIDGFMTVGSPLGLSEIHDNFDPDYNKRDAFPSSRVTRGWVNLYDRLDPVAFDAKIANDYQQNGQRLVQDERVRNGGVWRHSSNKYFQQDKLIAHLSNLLDLA
ncbi:MAG: hypothetical protein AB8B63_20510 [Granulosicoccus sp.]